MKKTNILKIFMTLVLAFVITGAFAQLATDNTNMISSGVQATDYVTVGGTLPYYVEPDGVFSPSFDASVSLTANVNTTFSWTLDASMTDGDATANDNYVELTFGATGNYTISVEETFSSCAGTPVTLDIEVIDAPDAEIAGTSGNINYTWSAVGSEYTACEPATTGTETITVTITEDADLPAALRSYALLINETVVNLLPDLATQDGADITNTDWDYTLAAKLNSGNAAIPGTHTWTPNAVGTATSTYELPTAALTVQNSKPTRYRYTIAQASDAGGSAGIISAISQKSEYGGAPTVNAFSGVTVVDYIVLPAPVTGPIYHIDNELYTN